LANDGQFAASIEKRGVLVDGTESKPADVYIPLWNYGKTIAIDIVEHLQWISLSMWMNHYQMR
jgi:hypothetical protein